MGPPKGPVTFFSSILMETDYQTAHKHAVEWLPLAVAEIKKQWGSDPLIHDGSLVETTDDVIKTIEVGGALIQLAVKEKNRSHRPVLIVTEKSQRKHRVGIGHSHDYPTMADGKPNFKKAISNAVTRAKEVEELTKGQVQVRDIAIDMKVVQAEELKGVKIPPEMIVNRRQDGHYVIHIGSAKVSLTKLRQMCELIARATP